MATQFLVRSPGNKHAISLKVVLYDGVGLSRVDESGMAMNRSRACKQGSFATQLTAMDHIPNQISRTHH
eukprot:scaffold17043_cov36-Cyclotella_meneghiniana.AAC.7